MTRYEIVDRLPDLISSDEYADDPNGERVRIQIRITNGVIEILGDSMRVRQLEELLERFGPEVVQQMLCG